MGGFSRSLLRQIRQVFPASTLSVNNPADISDDVQFTADYLPPTLRLDRMLHQSVQGALAAVVLDTTVVPDDRYWYVEACQGFHDDPVARDLQFFIRNDNLGVVGMLANSIFEADGAPVNINTQFFVKRSFLVPAGWRVRMAGSVAAAQRLNVSITYLELPVMEKSPQI